MAGEDDNAVDPTSITQHGTLEKLVKNIKGDKEAYTKKKLIRVQRQLLGAHSKRSFISIQAIIGLLRLDDTWIIKNGSRVLKVTSEITSDSWVENMRSFFDTLTDLQVGFTITTLIHRIIYIRYAPIQVTRLNVTQGIRFGR